MTGSLRERLISLLRSRSVRFGELTLASGRTSEFCVDVRQTALHADEGLGLEALMTRAQLVDGHR